jgi:prevent-host-death family protein
MLTEPGRVEEPQAVQEYAEVLSRVAREGQPVIVTRGGAEVAAVVPLEQWAFLRELLARQGAERLAREIDWDRAVQTLRPPQDWFDGDEPKPF